MLLTSERVEGRALENRECRRIEFAPNRGRALRVLSSSSITPRESATGRVGVVARGWWREAADDGVDSSDFAASGGCAEQGQPPTCDFACFAFVFTLFTIFHA